MSSIPSPINSSGLEGLPLTYTVEQESPTDRTEVLGIMAGFPSTGGIFESDLPDYHFAVSGAREHILQGPLTGVTVVNRTLVWGAEGFTISTNSIKIELIRELGGPHRVTYIDDGEGNIVFESSSSADANIDGLTSGTIDYATGALALTFNSISIPNEYYLRVWYDIDAGPEYPTDWTVMMRWPDNKIRLAKGWCGKADGTGVTIPGKPGDVEEFFTYFKVIEDASLTASLPTYTEHPAIAAAWSAGPINSDVHDSYSNRYRQALDPADVNWVEEDVLEDTAWMKVTRRRGYHQPRIVDSDANCTASITHRDLFSVTAYYYVPHNSRLFDLEIKLGNDYQGSDFYKHESVINLGTPDGSTTEFSATLEHAFDGTTYSHQLPDGRVFVELNGVEVGSSSTSGNSTTNESNTFFGDGVVDNRGSVNTSTGAVTVVFSSPPQVGDTIQVRYEHNLVSIAEGNGVQTTFSNTLPFSPNPHSLWVVSDDGVEGRDDGYGNIINYTWTPIKDEVVGTGDNVTTTFSGSLANTNVVTGKVKFWVGTEPNDYETSTVFGKDEGAGTFIGKNINEGTCSINYDTGAYTIVLDAAPAVGEFVYIDYGHYGGTPEVVGTINYATRQLDLTFGTAPTSESRIEAAYVRNYSSKEYDPNLAPIGDAGFNAWIVRMGAPDTAFTGMKMEALNGYRANEFQNGSGRVYTIAGGPQWNVRIPVGESTSVGYIEHEYLSEGSSLARLFYIYAGNGATTAEDDTWASKDTYNPLTPIPTLNCMNACRAYQQFEGTLKYISPRILGGEFNTLQFYPGSAAGEEFHYRENTSARVPSSATSWIGFSGSSSGDGYPFLGQSGGNYGVSPRGSRATFGHKENHDRPGASGTPRGDQSHAVAMYYGQSWELVRAYYHAGTHGFTRRGMTRWNFAAAYTWRRRPHYNYISGQSSAGLIPPNPLPVQPYYEKTRDFFGSAYRKAVGKEKVSVTNGSTSVVFDSDAGSGSSGGGQFALPNQLFIENTTWNGSVSENGSRRIIIEGSKKVYRCVSRFYDTGLGRWVVQLDSAYDGTTGTGRVWCAMSDPEEGVDIPDPRVDPRSYEGFRLGFEKNSGQNGFESENSSHASQDVQFEVWEVTGSWMMWDKIRHTAEYFIGSWKDNNPFTASRDFFGQFGDQMRSTSWPLKNIVRAYMVTKNFVGRTGFEFLTDPDYGSVKERIEEWIYGRLIKWWVGVGPKGYMDPLNQINKSILEFGRIGKGAERDWASPELVGSKDPQYGGGQLAIFRGANGVRTITEVEAKFGERGWGYLETWQLGYGSAHWWVLAREFRFDDTILELNHPTYPTETVSASLQRIAENQTNAFLDYCLVTGEGPHPFRRQPGYVTLHVNANFPGDYLIANPSAGLYFPINTSYRLFSGFSFANGDFNENIRVNPRLRDFDPIVEFEGWEDDASYPTPTFYSRMGSLGAAQDDPTFPADGDPSIDSTGWLVPGTGRHPDNSSEITTYENGHPFAGVPAPVPSIPGCSGNDPGGNFYPCLRAPEVLEGYSRSESLQQGCVEGNSATHAVALMMATKYHTDPVVRERAGRVLNYWLKAHQARTSTEGFYYGVNVLTGTGPEVSRFMSQAVGDFPYDSNPVNNGPTRWWDTNWSKRRRIENLNNADAYTTEDVYSVDITSPVDITASANPDFSDIRVVYQGTEGVEFELGRAIRFKPFQNRHILYFSPPVNLPANTKLHLDSSFAIYIYYGNTNPGSLPPYTNLKSLNGPFSVSADTLALWNQRDSIFTDDGPNNYLIQSFAGVEPTESQGEFGKALDLNLSSAFTFYGGTQTPPSNFTIEFTLRVEGDTWVTDPNPRVVLAQVSANSNPISVFFEGEAPPLGLPRKNLIANFSVGSGSVFQTKTLTIPGPAVVSLGTGNGVDTTFSVILGDPSIVPGSYSVFTSSGNSAYFANDGNGLGRLFGNISASSIYYEDVLGGTISITYNSPVPNAEEVYLVYSTDVAAYNVNRSTYIKYVYDGAQIEAYTNNTLGSFVPASGALQPLTGPEPKVGMTFGSAYDPATGGGQGLADGLRLSEIRIENAAIKDSRINLNFARTSLQSEEALSSETELSIASRGRLSGIAPELTLSSRGVIFSQDDEVTVAGRGYMVSDLNSELTIAGRAGIEDPTNLNITTRTSIAGPDSEIILDAIGHLAGIAPEKPVACGAFLIDEPVPSIDNELALTSEGAVRADTGVDAELAISSVGGIQDPDLELGISGGALLIFQDREVIKTFKASLLDEDNEHTIASRGIAASILELAQQSDSYVQAADNENTILTRGRLVNQGENSEQIRTISYLQEQDSELASEGRSGIAETLQEQTSSRGAIEEVIEESYESRVYVREDDKEITYSTEGALSSEIELSRSSRGALTVDNTEIPLEGKSVIRLETNLTLESEGFIVGSDTARQIITRGFILSDDLEASVPSRGVMANFTEFTITSRGNLLGSSDLPINTRCYLFTSAGNLLKRVPCIGSLATIRENTLDSRAVASKENTKVLSCGGHLVNPENILTPSSPNTLKAGVVE